MKKFLIGGIVLALVAFFAGVVLFRQPSVKLAQASAVADGCDHSCPVIHFEWTTLVYDNCPSGYSVRQGHNDQCKKNTSPFTVIDRPSHKVSHSADVAYDKSQDPHKCHRPSDNTLSNTYGMDQDARDAFKQDNAEWLDSKLVVPDGYYYSDGRCYKKTPVCADESALNFGGEDGKFDLEREVANNDLCKYPEVVDQCSNLSGVQETLPDGVQTNSDHICSCKDGYHSVPVTDNPDYVGTIQEQQDFTCVADSTPPSTEPPKQELSQAGPPVCSDGNILALPIAFKVVRQGDHATLTWYKTGGDLVNIYYKELGQANWTHAVGDVPNVDPSNTYVIGGLKPALGYVFAIQQHQGCAGGQLAESVVIDGPAFTPVTFNFSYWQWSK